MLRNYVKMLALIFVAILVVGCGSSATTTPVSPTDEPTNTLADDTVSALPGVATPTAELVPTAILAPELAAAPSTVTPTDVPPTEVLPTSTL